MERERAMVPIWEAGRAEWVSIFVHVSWTQRGEKGTVVMRVEGGMEENGGAYC